MIKSILTGLGFIAVIATLFIGYLLDGANINPTNVFNDVKPFAIAQAQDTEHTQQCKIDKSKALFWSLTQQLKAQSDRYVEIAQSADDKNNTAIKALAERSLSELEALSAVAQTALDCHQDAYDLNALTHCKEDLTASSLPYMTAFSKLEVKKTGSYEAALFKFGMGTTFGRRVHYLAINNNIIKQCS